MKNLIRLLLLLIVIGILCIYVFIPGATTVTVEQSLQAPSNRVSEFISNQQLWAKWWPGTRPSNPQSDYSYNENAYKPGRQTENISEMIIVRKSEPINGEILVAALSADSSLVQWNMRMTSTKNPFKRVSHYLNAGRLKSDMQDILKALNVFAANKENLYGMQVEHERVKDTVLVVTRNVFNHYPTTNEIYAMVDRLENYIKGENATATNAPMLHVQRTDTNKYDAMVGIPTNRALEGKGPVALKRMFAGNILKAEVKGGPSTVTNGLEELENYRSDHRLVAPAIPFIMLVTDRRKEPDSTKWITRLYYPVF